MAGATNKDDAPINVKRGAEENTTHSLSCATFHHGDQGRMVVSECQDIPKSVKFDVQELYVASLSNAKLLADQYGTRRYVRFLV